MNDMARKRVRVGGRPALNRDRHAFNPFMERDVDEILREQADTAGMTYAAYLELLVSEAHDYRGQYLRELSILPAAVQAEELRRRTAALTSQDCRGIGPDRAGRATVRVDRPVANTIEKRCDELDVQFSEYLRAIFSEAAGNPKPSNHDQLSLSLEDVEGGLARAS